MSHPLPAAAPCPLAAAAGELPAAAAAAAPHYDDYALCVSCRPCRLVRINARLESTKLIAK